MLKVTFVTTKVTEALGEKQPQGGCLFSAVKVIFLILYYSSAFFFCYRLNIIRHTKQRRKMSSITKATKKIRMLALTVNLMFQFSRIRVAHMTDGIYLNVSGRMFLEEIST